MLGILKNSLAVCTLLSSSFSLSASWRQTLYTALPRLTLAAEISRRTYARVTEYRHTQDVKKNTHTYAHESATKYVTTVLRKRNAIGQDEIVYGKWGDCYATYSDAIIQIPHEPESAAVIEKWGAPGMGLLHEEGHRHNRDSQKRAFVTNLLRSVSFGLGVFLGRKRIFTPATTLWNSAVKSAYTLVMPALFSTLTTFPLVQTYARHQERRADQYAITYAKSPEELEQEAAHYQNLAAKNPAPLAIISLLSTHPSDLERAQYFRAAADRLRAQKNNT